MSDRAVTIATFETPLEAGYFKSLLEAEGIPAFLVNENMAATAWHYNLAIGGIKLQVMEGDVGAALSVMKGTPAPAGALEEESRAEQEEEETADRSDDDSGEDMFMSPADKIACRAQRAALLGLFLPPLQLYAFYLAVRLLLEGRPLSGAGKRMVLTALFLCSYLVILCWLFLR